MIYRVKTVTVKSKIQFLYLAKSSDEETDIIYDEEGNAKKVKKEIDPLPPINHAKISYLPIEKNLYKVHADVESSSKTQINKLLGEIGIRIQGYQPQVRVNFF